MKISLEEIISMVVKEVLSELNRKGIKVDVSNKILTTKKIKVKTEIEIDMDEFKTPLITEEKVLNLEESVTTIVVPVGTKLTPNASELIRKRNLTIKTINKE